MDKRVLKKLDKVTPQIIEAYTNGTTLEALADLYEVSTGTVRNLLVSNEVPRRRRGRRKKENDHSHEQTMQPNP